MDPAIDVPLGQLMAEVQLLRAENAAILQGLTDASSVQMRVGVRISAQLGDCLLLLDIADISFITSNPDDTLSVCTSDAQRYVSFETLESLAARFASDPRLMLTHKSYFVNLNQIRAVDDAGGGRILTFQGWDDDTTAKVSDNHRSDFEARLGIGNA